MDKKTFDTPDDSFNEAKRIKLDYIELADKKLSRVTAAPGWKWSVDIKPFAKTDSCQVDHLLYMLSGKMVVKMDDGQELEFNPGDYGHIPAGHDGWGIGDESTVWLEFPH